MRTSLVSLLLAVFLLLPAADANAQIIDKAQFGPDVGYQMSPDAFTIGAHIIFYSLIESMPQLALGADFHYGFGTESAHFGDDELKATTIAISVLAYYVLSLSESMNVMPLAGLTYYKWQYDCPNFGGIFGLGNLCEYDKVALALGAGLAYEQFFLRLMLGISDVYDAHILVGYNFGSGRPQF